MTELHGNLHEVECMSCAKRGFSRVEFQHRLKVANPQWLPYIQEGAQCTTISAIVDVRFYLCAAFRDTARPDGDSQMNILDYSSFVVPVLFCVLSCISWK